MRCLHPYAAPLANVANIATTVGPLDAGAGEGLGAGLLAAIPEFAPKTELKMTMDPKIYPFLFFLEHEIFLFSEVIRIRNVKAGILENHNFIYTINTHLIESNLAISLLRKENLIGI